MEVVPNGALNGTSKWNEEGEEKRQEGGKTDK